MERTLYDIHFGLCFRLNRAVLRLIGTFLVKSRGLQLEKLGSDYGGWVVPVNMIKSDWICYCAGVGEDTTFDLALISRFGMVVHAFDPTPRAVCYVEENKFPQSFNFLSVGLWSSDQELKFYGPQNPAFVSHSVVNLQKTDHYFEASCKRLTSLMRQLNHERIDLLKLDIEGAEMEVLKDMMRERLRPGVICVEYDQPVSPLQMLCSILGLLNYGYRLVFIDKFNLTFVLDGEIHH